MSLNIVFAGTPDFASQILQILLLGSHTIKAVFTQPDRPAGRGRHLQMSPVKQLAIKYEIPVYQPGSLKTPEEQAVLQNLKPDLLIVVAYGLILPSAVLAIPKNGCWNVHASLLPHWRGASPIQQAILNGDSLSGITIMQMNAGLDTGDIISLHPCAIELRETSDSLFKRLADIAGPALVDALSALEQGQVTRQKQDSSKASYAPKISKAAAKIDWKQSAIQIDRKIRAFNPWPIAFFDFDNQSIRIFDAKPLVSEAASVKISPVDNISAEDISIENTAIPPGTIIAANDNGIDIATGNGILRLLELQFPGGKRQNIAAILHSKKALFQPGVQFP